MKKFLAILLALAMLFSLAACGKGEANNSKTESTEENDPWSYTFTQYGDLTIKIVGAEFIQDDWGTDVLRLYIDYTNNSDSAYGHSASSGVRFQSVTQDGTELDVITFGTLDECAIPEDLTCDCYTQPGCTSRQTILIPCDPNGGVVEVACYGMIGSWMFSTDDLELFTFQIDPKNLMGVPEPLEMPAITEPTYAAGLPTSGTCDYLVESEISIDGYELIKGDNDEDVLRVKLTVTNNGEDSWAPVFITNGVEVYQDGLSLLTFSDWDLPEPTAEDAAYNEDLDPGKTVQCNALFLLRNDNPAEVVIEDKDNEVRLGMICDIQAAKDAIQDAEDAEQAAAAAAEAAAKKAIIGTWLERDSAWENTYTFYEDGTGFLLSGPVYPFTYEISGETLILTYDEDDTEEFTLTIDGDLMTLVDWFDDELLLDKQAETLAPPTESEVESEVESKAEDELLAELIGTWLADDGETYVFNEDGTGYQIYEDVKYTYTYTLDGDYVDISYDDGDSDHFSIIISDDELIIANNWKYTRQ